MSLLGFPLEPVYLDLMIWAANLVFIPFFIYKRRWDDLLPTSVFIFFLLLIPIFIGLNTPNPDNVILIQVTTP